MIPDYLNEDHLKKQAFLFKPVQLKRYTVWMESCGRKRCDEPSHLFGPRVARANQSSYQQKNNSVSLA